MREGQADDHDWLGEELDTIDDLGVLSSELCVDFLQEVAVEHGVRSGHIFRQDTLGDDTVDELGLLLDNRVDVRVLSGKDDQSECHAVILASLVIADQIVLVLCDENSIWRIGSHSLEAGGLAESVGEVVYLALVHASLI